MVWKPLHIPSKTEMSDLQRDYGKKARFLVDECLGAQVANLLKRSGWNAKFAGDVGLSGRDDHDVFAFAYRDNRILLTHDEDYLDNRQFPEHSNPGVVILPGGMGDETALIEALKWTLSVIGQHRELWRKSKVTIRADGRFTVMSRDISTGAISTQRYWFKDGDILIWEDD